MSKHGWARAARLLALGLWLLANSASAQRFGPPWEQSVTLPAPVRETVFLGLRATPGGYWAAGNGDANPNFPHIYARYDTAGTLQWQRRGRIMISGEQDLKPWGNRWVFAGSIAGPLLSGWPNPLPYLQKIKPNGDTLPGVTYRAAATSGFITCVLPDSRGFSLVGYTFERLSGGPGSNLLPIRYQLIRTDTAGTLLWQRTYGSPLSYGNAYGTDAVRRPDGGYLLTGSAQAGTGFHPMLIVTDSLGNERKRKILIIQDSARSETYNRLWGHTLELPNGEGYVLNCRVSVPVPNQPIYSDVEAWVVAVDTALNVRWQTRLPGGRSTSADVLRVYRQADGTLLVATYDIIGQPASVLSSNLYVHRLSATGQWLSRRTLTAGSNTTRIRAYDWQPLAGDSVVVVTGTAVVGGGNSAGWIARLRATTPRQVTALAGAVPAGQLSLYPNPAAGATARVTLPAGLGRGATLTLHDAVGRQLHRQMLPGAEAAVPLAGLPPGLYVVQLTAADGRRWTGRLLRQ